MKLARPCLLLLCASIGWTVTITPSWAAEAQADGARSRDRFALTIKTGRFYLADDNQVIAGRARQFDDAVDALAIEGETPMKEAPRVSVGGEILRYASRFGRVNAPGSSPFEDKMETWTILAKAKYFIGSGTWRPYVGGGIGLTWITDFEGPIEGLVSGIAAQAVAGMELRWHALGVRAEYSYLRARIDDDKSDKIDASGGAALIGVSFRF